MNKFSVNLKHLRESSKLTQEELATSLGISRSTIGMYESGAREPNFEMLEIIADYFNVDMSDLLGTESTNESTATKGSGRINEAIYLFNALPPERKQQALDYLRFLSNLEDS